jgi:hypothetical protein|tara:strand:+ start:122 stop:637 length:516 start_codon:yes stop_codon:yes gene_type:complete
LHKRFDYCFSYGKNAEARFADSFLSNFTYATKYQDIYEHWDVVGVLTNILDKAMKFDVKSAPRLKHSPTAGIMESVWVEGTNVSGNKGWVKGNADYIVFERENTWMIVNRKELLALTEKKLKDNNFKKGKGNYKKATAYLLYSRLGRKDKITQVIFDDMKVIEHYEVNKKG